MSDEESGGVNFAEIREIAEESVRKIHIVRALRRKAFLIAFPGESNLRQLVGDGFPGDAGRGRN